MVRNSNHAGWPERFDISANAMALWPLRTWFERLTMTPISNFRNAIGNELKHDKLICSYHTPLCIHPTIRPKKIIRIFAANGPEYIHQEQESLF